jgi:hypothetical protein
MDLPKDKVLIKIRAIVHDDADDFDGAIIDDFDRANCVASLIVDSVEVDADTISKQELFTSEAWGQVAVFREEFIEVMSCTWNGYPIINYEDVCERLHHHGI